MTARVDRHLLALIALTFAGYLAAMPVMLERLDPLTGDEPFYVMTAISMVRDRNLDETGNYARRDYEEFYPPQPLPADWNGWPAFPRTLPPHPAVTDRDGLYTKHGLGLSFLIALPYELVGRGGAVLVVVLAATLVAGNMYLLARESGTQRTIAMGLASGMALTLPMAPYALLLFPEIPAAAMLVYAIRRVSSVNNEQWQFALTGCAIGFLPWLHQRFAPSAAVLAAILAYRVLRSHNVAAAISSGVPVAVGAISIVSYNMWLYGSPVQNTGDHAGFNNAAGTINGLFGLMLDAQWGLMIVAPIYLVALTGLPAWLRSNRDLAASGIMVALPYIGVVAAYQVWWGEWGPPARYLVPIAPLAAAPIGCVLTRAATPGRIVAGVLALPGIVFTLIMLGDPQRMYHHPDGYNNLVGRLGELLGTDMNRLLVAFQPLAIAPVTDRILVSFIFIVALALVAMWIYAYPTTHET